MREMFNTMREMFRTVDEKLDGIKAQIEHQNQIHTHEIADVREDMGAMSQRVDEHGQRIRTLEDRTGTRAMRAWTWVGVTFGGGLLGALAYWLFSTLTGG
jgi:hypothetical protein